MNECLFCKIIGGQVPSINIFENSEFKVILDAFPASKGHVLIVTKEHYKNIFEIDADTAARLFALATHISRTLRQALGCDGINILQNNGVAAGQTIEHFHLHIIPRFLEDKVGLHLNSGAQADRAALEELAALIKKGL